MRDHRALVDTIALLDTAHALAGIFELGPAFEHVDELEVALVDMPLLDLVGDLLAVVANDVGDEIAVGRVLEAKVAVFEDLAQARREKFFNADVSTIPSGQKMEPRW